MTRGRDGRVRVQSVGRDGRRREVWGREEAPEIDDRLELPPPRPAIPSRLPDGYTVPEGVAAHDLAAHGIHTVLAPDGRLVAHNTNGPGVVCVHCGGERHLAATCEHCVGRGVISDVPFCDREWDLVAEAPPGGGQLWLGGHDCQPGGGDCRPRDRFGLVVSLYVRSGQEPDARVEHLSHTMMDGDLHPDDHSRVDELADAVADRAARGRDVLVRCQAGMNRSGLVMGLAMVKLGWDPDEAIAKMREVRGPFVLFNESFVRHIRSHC